MTQSGLVACALTLGPAAATPGPGVVALVAPALAFGFWADMAFAVGLMLGDLTYLAAAVFGLNPRAPRLTGRLRLQRLIAQVFDAEARQADIGA